MSIPLLCVLMCPGATAPATGTATLREDFQSLPAGPLPAKAWRTTGFTWRVHRGGLVCEDPGKTFAVARALPHGRRVTVEARLAVTRAVGTQWKIAGVALHRDARNYWHLAMVEAPTDEGQAPRRSFELTECLRGRWLANYEGPTALPQRGRGLDGTWRPGVRYRFRLAVTPEGIAGTVTDANGRAVYERAFRFPAGTLAVTTGRPALDCGDFLARFDDVAFAVSDPVAPPASQAPPRFPPYDRPPASDLRREATGFFRVERIDGTWWLIDPKGYACYGIGTDHVRYGGHGCEQLGYAPYGRSMARRFPDEGDWAAETVGRLEDWGFNTVAAGHSPSVRHRGLAHTEFISFGARFSSYSDITPKVHWTGFPDVFHPCWETYCRKMAEDFCRRQASDPWLLGYFLDNELEWYGKSHAPYGLVAEAWAKPPDHAAKAALVALLKARHGTIEKLNAAWGTRFESFDALAAGRDMPRLATPAADADRDAYLALIAERYFGACCRAIRAVDPNHMVLGSRFAGSVHDGVWRVAGRHLDIVSVNQYERVDLATGTAGRAAELLARYHELCGRPLLLTEWSFPALDSGLPCTKGAGMRVDTQAQRAEAFGIYQTMLFRRPFLVGSHFFMWVDEPALGVSSTFPENSNYGLVDERGRPWPELTAAAARLNPRAVDIHAGRTSEIAVRIDAPARRAVLTNTGKRPAAVPVECRLDGACRRKTVRVGAGEAATIPLVPPADGGPRFAVVRADPNRTLPEADLSDNAAAAHLPTSGLGASKAIARIDVGNPTARALANVVVRVPFSRLGARGAVRVTAAGDGSRPAQQCDEGEVVLRVDELPAYGAARFWATPTAAGAGPIKTETLRPPFEVAAGPLKLVKRDDDGDLIDDVVLDGVSLGRVQALVHENVGRDLWLAANRLVSVERIAGPVETTLEFVAEYRSAGPAGPSGGCAYRARYRLRADRAGGTFALRCLSVTNVGARPWRLVSYFHYLPSHLGGSTAGDAVSAGDVPNYYGLQTVWYDASASAGYGAVVPDPLAGHYWLDPGGRQHPDIRRDIGRALPPGQTWTAPADEPAIRVFGVRGPADRRPWRALADNLRARSRVLVAVSRP